MSAARVIVGGVRSNSNPGTTTVPLHVSCPGKPGPFEKWSTVPAPEAPANLPDPPVTVKVSVPLTGEGGVNGRQSAPLTRTSIAPLPDTVKRAVEGRNRSEAGPQPAGVSSTTGSHDSSTRPSPRTSAAPFREKHPVASAGVPGGQARKSSAITTCMVKVSVPAALPDASGASEAHTTAAQLAHAYAAFQLRSRCTPSSINDISYEALMAVVPSRRSRVRLAILGPARGPSPAPAFRNDA